LAGANHLATRQEELLRAVIEQVIITVDKDHNRAHLTLRWRGDAIVEIDLDLPRRRAMVRTDETPLRWCVVWQIIIPMESLPAFSTVSNVRRYGHRFTANLVTVYGRNWDIPCFERPTMRPTENC